jgi:RNA polymerase sigma factor (sigma-70 family)
MATAFRSGTLGLIQHLFDRGTCTGLSDARLLERFVNDRDEAAFAALVARHGALVLNTCRAVLKDPNAADDAFQATFVLLFRKAGSIRGHDALGAWLHRVAYRTALRARADDARRRDAEKLAGELRVAGAPDHDDLGAVLHEEIERLPDRLRLPVVLCYLDGMTRDQAADHLRCSEGMVQGRLAKGRALLQRRLTRRGIALAVPPVTPAAIPESLVATAVRAATGATSAAVASSGWIPARFKAAMVLAIGLGIAAAGFACWSVDDSERPRATARPRPPDAQVKAPKAVPAMPVEGRVLDLEGRPVAGASVSVTDFESPLDGNLEVWIDELKRLGQKTSNRPVPIVSTDRRPVSSATTGPDGRFRIEGLSREGIATMSIAGPGIETSTVHIMTRDMPMFRAQVPMIVNGKNYGPVTIYHGARFDHVAARTRPIVGTVRDKDTGAPIPGVSITGNPNIPNSLTPTPGVEATTDAQGRYRLDGLPTSGGFKLYTNAPAGQPYVNFGFLSPAPKPGTEPFPFDLALKRGVLVHGRLTDKATGKPLRARVHYHAFADNLHLDEYPNFKRGSLDLYVFTHDDEGRFTIPALPGRGLITARTQFPTDYINGLGAEDIKGFDRRMMAFHTVPSYCHVGDKAALAEINPKPGTQEITLELRADPGRTIKGTIVDPAGRSIGGEVEIHRLDGFRILQHAAGDLGTFSFSGFTSGSNRLDFIDRRRKLAGALVLRGEETGDLTVKLQPWGTVIGRVVDEEGKPRNDVEVYGTIRERPDIERGSIATRSTVDARGRFRVEGLVPGIKYDASGHSASKAFGPILDGVQVGPGEVKDLGDITLPAWKPPGIKELGGNIFPIHRR